jgi:hypothetical protein
MFTNVKSNCYLIFLMVPRFRLSTKRDWNNGVRFRKRKGYTNFIHIHKLFTLPPKHIVTLRPSSWITFNQTRRCTKQLRVVRTRTTFSNSIKSGIVTKNVFFCVDCCNKSRFFPQELKLNWYELCSLWGSNWIFIYLIYHRAPSKG